MTYRWRATYTFDYPLLDLPIDICDIRLCPAPPELDGIPRAIHCYEFETAALDRDAQQEVEKMYLVRLEQLTELSAFAPYYTEVSFHSLVLIDGGGSTGYPPSGINFRSGGKPYVPPGQPPEKLRQELLLAAQPFVELQSLREEVREPICRAVRWLYRGRDYRIPADDRLMYRWIAFNSLYTLLNSVDGSTDRSERASVREFEERFRHEVGVLVDGAHPLASGGLKLDRGRDRDVSLNLQQSIQAGDTLVTQRALECIYAARCSLFHGAERPAVHVSNIIMSVAAAYLDLYLRKALRAFIAFCKTNS